MAFEGILGASPIRRQHICSHCKRYGHLAHRRFELNPKLRLPSCVSSHRGGAAIAYSVLANALESCETQFGQMQV